MYLWPLMISHNPVQFNVNQLTPEQFSTFFFLHKVIKYIQSSAEFVLDGTWIDGFGHNQVNIIKLGAKVLHHKIMRACADCVLYDICRFWDLAYPERSYIVAGGANDSLHCPSVFYNRKIIEGTEVVQV